MRFARCMFYVSVVLTIARTLYSTVALYIVSMSRITPRERYVYSLPYNAWY
jgi:hypothetical protein